MNIENQRTIKNPVTISGRGLHTGAECSITFKPSSANSGYIFQRIDLPGQPIVKALVENVSDTSRGTTIEENGVRVCTVEHALSALFGLGIDNALIEIDGPEVPILNGSAGEFVQALMSSGIEELDEPRAYFEIKQTITYREEDTGIEYIAFPDDDYNVTVLIDYNSKVLVNQYASLDSIENYRDEISKARTFVFLHELEPLLKNNLIKGGDLDNAIVIVDKEVSKSELDRLADLFNKPHLEVEPSKGILNNVELNYTNEPARHKLLDVIGDLSLIGHPIKGKIIASRPGHRTNVQFAKQIKQQIKKERSKNYAPMFDIFQKPLFDINQIRALLPHRYPFLLVDKILEMDSNSVVGLKNVTYNEAFFTGHFPEEPVMPGVLIVEAMAQVGGILVLNAVPDPENYATYLLKIDQVRFKRKVFPGDTIIFKLEFIAPVRRGIASMKGVAYVGENVVMEGELLAQISKNE